MLCTQCSEMCIHTLYPTFYAVMWNDIFIIKWQNPTSEPISKTPLLNCFPCSQYQHAYEFGPPSSILNRWLSRESPKGASRVQTCVAPVKGSCWLLIGSGSSLLLISPLGGSSTGTQVKGVLYIQNICVILVIARFFYFVVTEEEGRREKDEQL